MIRTPTPTEELEIRQHCEEAWEQTWANATDLTPKQAFIEGHYLAFWCGILAAKQVRENASQQIWRLETRLNLAITALVVAVAWGLIR